jgi:DNA-binding NtrC family response regulator
VNDEKKAAGGARMRHLDFFPAGAEHTGMEGVYRRSDAPSARFVEPGAKREEGEMKRRILLVDDEVAVLLTLKAVLEINGFEVDTAASAREGRMKLRSHEYDMVISDMRMECEQSGAEVIAAARSAPYQPAVALLTAFPLADEDWQEMGADRMLVKPMHTRILLEQIDRLMESHGRHSTIAAASEKQTKTASKKTAGKRAPAKRAGTKKAAKPAAERVMKAAAKKKTVKKKVVAKA